MGFDAAALLDGLGEAELGAVVETMYLAAAADGEFSAEEHRLLCDRIARLSRGRLTGERLAAMLADAAGLLGQQGLAARLQSLRERLPEAGARRGALGLAICLMAVDGIVRTSERELIYDLAAALDIDHAEAADLVAELGRPQ